MKHTFVIYMMSNAAAGNFYISMICIKLPES